MNTRPVTQLSKQGISLERSDAYSIQESGILFREKAGERKIGLKMGLTSEGKRKQMNLDSPLYGELTDKMQIRADEKLNISQLIHPKIEPEIAFLLKQDLEGIVTVEQVLEATSAVCACLEILDSRYEQFKYFSMEDVIADNSSSSHFILGSWYENFRSLDLRSLSMKMFVNGELAHEALSSEISGDPAVSIVELCRLLSQRKRKLTRGTVVLAGAATAAVSLSGGMKVTLEVKGLPPVGIEVQGLKQ